MTDTKLTKRGENGNTNHRARKWCFTLNNYTLDDVDTLIRKWKTLNYVFQEETGVTGTQHLQGYVEFNNARWLSALHKEFKRFHWEVMRNEQAAINYCQKSDTRTGNIYSNIITIEPLNIPRYDQLYEWQKNVIDICHSKPDDRTVYWFWEYEGCSGKTTLIKYIMTHFNNAEFSCACKSADILTIASERKSIYLLNFTRTQEGFAPYSAIEQLKDGLISDSKLKKKSNNIIINSPHVICFANWKPNTITLSQDRWKIIKIELQNEVQRTHSNTSTEH